MRLKSSDGCWVSGKMEGGQNLGPCTSSVEVIVDPMQVPQVGESGALPLLVEDGVSIGALTLPLLVVEVIVERGEVEGVSTGDKEVGNGNQDLLLVEEGALSHGSLDGPLPRGLRKLGIDAGPNEFFHKEMSGAI